LPPTVLGSGLRENGKERRMSGTSQQITIGPKDAAWIVREDGKMELIMPTHGEDVPIPDEQMLLIGCAAGFRDERLHDLVGEILCEKMPEKDPTRKPQ
jgi:hypothetical protein